MRVTDSPKIHALYCLLRRHEVGVCTVAVFLVGILIRLALLSEVTFDQRPEPVKIALSLIKKGTYADAFGNNVGPTAHCLPLHPLLLAAVFRIFGLSATGLVVISILASTSASLCYALLPSLGEACGFGILPGLLAGMIGALVPVNFWAQTNWAFEAPYTALVLVELCLLISRCWTLKSFAARDGVRVGILGGLACLLNASVILVLIAWLLVGTWRFRSRAAHFVRFSAIVALLVIATLAPWAIRNYLVFGRLIWTRSNFGLELSNGNSDYATAEVEFRPLTSGFITHHPSTSEIEREKVRGMGELRYNEARRRQAVDWIISHPARFACLTVQRVFFFWFPPMFRKWQTALEAVFTALALCGLISLIKTRDRSAWPIVAVLAAYPLVYYIVAVSPRYRYAIEPLLLLLGGYFLSSKVTPFIGGHQRENGRSFQP